MIPVLTPAAMGEADRAAIAAGTPEAVLMERAGRAVARAVRRVAGGSYGRRVVVVCGKGNNGGDGLVAARVLRSWGVRADVFLLAGGVDRSRFDRALDRADVAVDAMFGTGFRGDLEGDAAWVARRLSGGPVPVVAVDIPSGVDGETGAVAGEAVAADVTVCFAALKPGLCFQPGAARAGSVEVVDIGVDPGVPPAGVTEAVDVASWLPDRPPDAQKWSVGGVMVVGGSGGMTGAPLLVSRAALRAGAGIVWCCLPGSAPAARASGGEVITKALPATPTGSLDRGGAEAVLRDAGRFRALVLGPGLGTDAAARAEATLLAAQAPVPLVLDADGLNALEGDLAPLRVRRAGLSEATVLTPHGGEYARLTGRPVGDDRLAATRRLADDSESVVLLKGPGTVVAEPGGRAVVNPTGGPWLATAGTGDVLAGILGAFLARGLPAFEAAAAAAWVHGRSADVAADALDAGPEPEGILAGDLVGAIPRTLAALRRATTTEEA